MILPIPYGYAFTFSHMGFFYLLHRKYPPKSSTSSSKADPESTGGGLNESLSSDQAETPTANPLEGTGDAPASPAGSDGMPTPGRF